MLPLKDRTIHSSNSMILSVCQGWPVKYKQYQEERLSLASKAVQEGMTLRQASEEFKVPRSTIQEKCSLGLEAVHLLI